MQVTIDLNDVVQALLEQIKDLTYKNTVLELTVKELSSPQGPGFTTLNLPESEGPLLPDTSAVG